MCVLAPSKRDKRHLHGEVVESWLCVHEAMGSNITLISMVKMIESWLCVHEAVGSN